MDAGVSVNSEKRTARLGEPGILKSSAVFDGSFRPEENKAIVSAEVARARVTPEAGTVIFSRINTPDRVGESGYVPQDRPDLFLPDRLWRLSVDSARADAKWLAALLTSSSVRRQIAARATGTSGTMKNISKAAFSSIEIWVPSVDEQEAIVSFLSTVDHKTDLVAARLLALQDYYRGLADGFFDGSIRFPGLTGAWVARTLGECFTERSQRAAGSSQELLSVTMDRGVVLQRETGARDVSSGDKSNYKQVEVGDVVYNTMRMWQGAGGVARHRGIVSPAYTVVTPIEGFSSEYFGHLFKTSALIRQFARFSQGMTSDTWNLRFGNFSQVRVNVPEWPEQVRIAEVLSTVVEAIEVCLQRLAEMQSLRRGLIENMFVRE